MTTIFIDRSNNNGADDYKKAPVTHAYFKATDGTGFVDATYKPRVVAARTAGAVVGGYHYAEKGDPAAEADHFLSVVGTPKADGKHFRPCLDLEGGQTIAWAEACVRRCHAALGYLPVLYGNTSQLSVLRAGSVLLRECPWWRAEYGPNNGTLHALQGGDQGAAAHQYTSVAKVPGISGNTDLSVFLSAAGLASMLVPPKPVKATRPDHYTLAYTDVFGHRQYVETKYPGLWRSRHRRANWRGDIVIHPIHKK